MYHAKLAASQTHRWLQCPASIPFIDQLREYIPASSSPYADEGIYAHEVLNHQLEVMYKNKVPKEDYFNFPDQWALDIAIEYVQDKMLLNPDASILLEKYVTPISNKDCGGTVDIAILTKRELEIIDYKHGRGVYVSPDWNTQLLTYALGILNETDRIFDRVKLTIIQPRHGEAIKASLHKNGILSIVYPISKITKTFHRELSDGIARVMQTQHLAKNPTWTMNKAYEQGHLSPGIDRKACRFCDLKALCPATGDEIVNAINAIDEFKDFDTDIQNTTVSTSTLLSDTAISNLIDLYTRTHFLKDAIKQIEELVLTLLELENPPSILLEHFKLEKRYGHRKWSSTKSIKEIIAKMEELGYGKTDCYDVRLKSPSAMLKMISKADTSNILEYIEKPYIGNKIVPKI